MAYLELLDADRMAEAVKVDDRYHLAKLVAAAFNDPARIWEEHERVRDAMLAALAPEDMDRPAVTLADAWAITEQIHRRVLAAGLIPPNHGAN